MTTRTALYRHYCPEGVCQYIGITDNPTRRLREHVKAGKWPIACVEVSWHPTREEAEQCERIMIRNERPPHNVQHVGNKVAPQEQGVFREAFVHALANSEARLADIVNEAGVSRDVLNKLIARAGSSTTAENAVAIAQFFGSSVEQMIADAQEARQ